MRPLHAFSLLYCMVVWLSDPVDAETNICFISPFLYSLFLSNANYLTVTRALAFLVELLQKLDLCVP